MSDPVRTERNAMWAVFGKVVGALALLGLVLGVIWWAWSPARPQAYVISTHRFAGLFDVAAVQPAEEESWVAADGRFAVITFVVGLLTGYAAWRWREVRGPVMVAALAIGSVIGAALTGLVGFLLGGGHITGKPGAIIVTRLNVHAYGLYFLQAVVAVTLYCISVAFAHDDDLSVEPTGSLVGADR